MHLQILFVSTLSCKRMGHTRQPHGIDRKEIMMRYMLMLVWKSGMGCLWFWEAPYQCCCVPSPETAPLPGDVSLDVGPRLVTLGRTPKHDRVGPASSVPVNSNLLVTIPRYLPPIPGGASTWALVSPSPPGPTALPLLLCPSVHLHTGQSGKCGRNSVNGGRSF